MNFLIDYIVPVIHVFACLFLIVVVLLQTGKGADMGAVFGGGSTTLFGSGGAGNLLTKLTTGTAIAFMLTSLVLSYGYRRSPGSSLIERLPAESAPLTAPAAPAAPAAQGTAIPVVPAPTPAPAAEGTAAIPVVPAPTPAPADAPPAQ